MSSSGSHTRRAIVAAAACWALLIIAAPAASPDPSTDALGFVDSTARCTATNTAVAFGSTATSRVAICKSPTGQYGYHGVRITDGATLIASATAATDGSFVAQHDGITYTVTSSALLVSDGNQVIRREPMVSYHGPKTAQAPAATPEPAAALKPSTPTSTAPVPPPLPAELGGTRH